MARPTPLLPVVRRPQLLREVEMLARTHTEMAINVLASIARNEAAPAPARVSAAEALLDRGWGKSKQIVQVDAPAELMSDDALEDAIRDRLRAISVEGQLAIEDARSYDDEGGGGPEARGSAAGAEAPGIED